MSDTDALMRLSRQATTAAVATEQYHEKLKRSAEQLRKELSSMEERGGSKSSSPPALSQRLAVRVDGTKT